MPSCASLAKRLLLLLVLAAAVVEASLHAKETLERPTVDARARGKHGKEGKGKDRPPNPDADLECNYCHKKGHRSANCRKRIADEKKKADNNNGKDRGDSCVCTFRQQQ